MTVCASINVTSATPRNGPIPITFAPTLLPARFPRSEADRHRAKLNPMSTLLAKNAEVLVTMDSQHRELKNAGLYVEDGFINTSELVETIGSVRKVEMIYSKDFSELTGLRATIITAS